MMAPMTDAAPGWFPDSNQQGRLRWWDGKAWTDHYHDQPATTPPGPPAPARGARPGPPLAISIVLLVLGVVIFSAGSITVGVSVFRNVTTGNTMTVPGRARFHLSSGNYLIYESVGTSREGGGDLSIDAGSVRITGPDGAAVAVNRSTGVTQTITRGNTDYEGAVDFKIDETGDYAFEVLDARPGRALVARSLGDTFRRALPWILIGGVGFVAAVAGLVMVIVGSVRRKRWSAGR